MRFIAVLALLGCVPKDAEVLEHAPDWTTPTGRESIRIDMAHALMDGGQVREAMQVLAAGAADGSDSVAFDLARGRAFLMDGMYAEARPLLERAAASMKHDARPYRWLGVLEADAGNPEAAIAAFRAAIRADDNDAAAWNNLGFSLLSAGEMSEAKDALVRAVALDATNARYKTNLGFALAALGNESEALESFRSANGEAGAWANLGLARELGGRQPEARDAYRRALDEDPNQSQAKEGLARLDLKQPPPERTP